MASASEAQTAIVNRSIRTIKAELEYLCDASVISLETLHDLLGRIPPQTALRAPLSVGATPQAVTAATTQPPSAALNNLSVRDQPTGGDRRPHNEKTASYYEAPSPQPPPSYASPPPQPNWPPLAQATAMYAYSPTEPTDLELQPNDQIAVVEYMNAEWWKGRSSRTGRTGIFPRSYVRVDSDNRGSVPPTPQPAPTSYGNMPLEVSQQPANPPPQNKHAGLGKEIGKKFGNAALFGAGATFGGDIVNAIL